MPQLRAPFPRPSRWFPLASSIHVIAQKMLMGRQEPERSTEVTGAVTGCDGHPR